MAIIIFINKVNIVVGLKMVREMDRNLVAGMSANINF